MTTEEKPLPRLMQLTLDEDTFHLYLSLMKHATAVLNRDFSASITATQHALSWIRAIGSERLTKHLMYLNRLHCKICDIPEIHPETGEVTDDEDDDDDDDTHGGITFVIPNWPPK